MYQMSNVNVISVHKSTLTYWKGSVIIAGSSVELISSGSPLLPDNGGENTIYERNYVYFRNSSLFMNNAENASFTEDVNNIFTNALNKNISRQTKVYLEITCISVCHERCLGC